MFKVKLMLATRVLFLLLFNFLVPTKVMLTLQPLGAKVLLALLAPVWQMSP